MCLYPVFEAIMFSYLPGDGVLRKAYVMAYRIFIASTPQEVTYRLELVQL